MYVKHQFTTTSFVKKQLAINKHELIYWELLILFNYYHWFYLVTLHVHVHLSLKVI